MNRLPPQVWFGVEMEGHGSRPYDWVFADGWRVIGDGSLEQCGDCEGGGCGHDCEDDDFECCGDCTHVCTPVDCPSHCGTSDCPCGCTHEHDHTCRVECNHNCDWDCNGDEKSTFEIRTPILEGEAGLVELEREILPIAQHVHVGEDCGLHVHFDVGRALAASEGFTEMSQYGNEDALSALFRRLLISYRHFWEPMGGLVAPSRRSNRYCRAPSHRISTDFNNLVNSDRYQAVNVASFSYHKTVEFRQYQGTFDLAEITNWVRLCWAFMRTACGGEALQEDYPATKEAMFDWLRLDKDIRDYYKGKQAPRVRKGKTRNILPLKPQFKKPQVTSPDWQTAVTGRLRQYPAAEEAPRHTQLLWPCRNRRCLTCYPEGEN
jgi:hypothetical protein